MSHSLPISQTTDLHDWFYSLPAIILPFLQQCFLKYACPTFPHHLPNSNGCPWLSPLFSSASSPFLPLLNATLLYLRLTQFPGLIHPRRWGRLCSSRLTETDRQTDTKADQQAGKDASAVPITVPTHPLGRLNPSLSAFFCQTQLFFFVLTAPDVHTFPPR